MIFLTISYYRFITKMTVKQNINEFIFIYYTYNKNIMKGSGHK